MKRKAVLIKDFHNENGTLHRTEKVIVEHEKDIIKSKEQDGYKYIRIPRHILKNSLTN